MKQILVTVLLVLALSASGQEYRTVQWWMFNPIYPADSTLIAYISLDTTYTITPKYWDKGLLYVVFDFKIVVNQKHSWVKGWLTTDELLKHEQAHYDLQWSYMAAAKYLLDNAEWKTIEDADRSVQKFFSEVEIAHRDFDDKTKHGTDKVAEARWEQAIYERLMYYKERI